MRTKEDKIAARREFSRRLQTMMMKKGLSQTELAAACKNIAPADVRFERDTISSYIRGIAFPTPKRLSVIATVLGCEPRDLVPVDFVPVAFTEPPRAPCRKFESLSDGTVWLTVNQAVPFDVALKVMEILKSVS
jgi:transcriptional regulator with XRE-family HTH domain